MWRRLLWIIPLAFGLLFLSFAFFRAQRVLSRAGGSSSLAEHIAFTLQPFDPADSLRTSFEPVASQPSYRSAAWLGSYIYLAGPAGLTVVSSSGSTRYTLRTGIELPVAPVTAVTTGRARGDSDQQVLIATSGAGLFLLTPSSGAPVLRQLLPAVFEARDLTSVLPLASGDLLLGTRHRGLLLFNGANLVPFRFALPGIDPAQLEVTALAAVDAASFLMGTRDQGVFYMHAGTVTRCDETHGLPDEQVEAIAVANRHAYIGTPVGTADFDLDSPAFLPSRILDAGTFSHTLQPDDSTLLIGTLDQGVRRITLDTRPHLRRVSIGGDSPQDPSMQRVDAFISTPSTLFSVADGKLFRHLAGGWTPALPPVSSTLSDRNISALAFAAGGSLYVGFFDRGLDILSPAGDTIRHLEDDHLFCINRLAFDPVRKTIVAATANGLVLFDAQGSPRQTLTRRDGLISDHVTDIAFTATGTALATPAGITFLGPAGTESLYAFEGLVNNHVYALAAGRDPDQLAAGTLGGLSLLQGTSVQRSFTAANSSLKHNWITALAPTPDGGYLVGTYGAGLQKLDRTGNFTAVELPANAPHDLVINPNAIFATVTHLYAGTLGHGLLVYSNAGGRWSLLSDGLPSLNVTAFAERAGQLYVGTDNGLVRITEANLP